MHETSPTEDAARASRRRDSGLSFVEILIAIVLLGGVVSGSMVTLRATILSGTIQRDHANAHGWLQSASDVLYAHPKQACDPSSPDFGHQAIVDEYDAVIDAVANPQGWKDWQIRVVAPIKFWNSGQLDADPDVEFFFGSDCDPSLTLQLIVIEVRSTNGKIIESVEIVK
ncbi:MAG: type IV pilus modification PilV family protein [Ilumatobacteraceae bacterium]